MKQGDRTPWGTAETVTQLADEVWIVETPNHGGLRLDGRARTALPGYVRHTFINGGAWAEEDLEMTIALAFLATAGVVADDKLTKVFEDVASTQTLVASALRIAENYERYQPAVRDLEAMMAAWQTNLPLGDPAATDTRTAGAPAA